MYVYSNRCHYELDETKSWERAGVLHKSMIAEIMKKKKKKKEIIIIKHMLRDESNKSVELFIWKIKELCCELN